MSIQTNQPVKYHNHLGRKYNDRTTDKLHWLHILWEQPVEDSHE